MIKSTVRVFDHFPVITEAVDRLARDAVQAAAEAAAEEAKTIGAARGLTDVQVIPAHGDVDGWTAGVAGRWYYRFQSYGTLGRAINPKRPGTKRSHAPGTGVTPNRMWQKARTAGRRALLARVKRGI